MKAMFDHFCSRTKKIIIWTCNARDPSTRKSFPTHPPHVFNHTIVIAIRWSWNLCFHRTANFLLKITKKIFIPFAVALILLPSPFPEAYVFAQAFNTGRPRCFPRDPTPYGSVCTSIGVSAKPTRKPGGGAPDPARHTRGVA